MNTVKLGEKVRKIEITTEKTTVIRLAGKSIKRKSSETRYRNLVIKHE